MRGFTTKYGTTRKRLFGNSPITQKPHPGNFSDKAKKGLHKRKIINLISLINLDIKWQMNLEKEYLQGSALVIHIRKIWNLCGEIVSRIGLLFEKWHFDENFDYFYEAVQDNFHFDVYTSFFYFWGVFITFYLQNWSAGI